MNMKEETREYLHSSRLYIGVIIGALITYFLGNAALSVSNIGALMLVGLLGGIIGAVIARPVSYTSGAVTGAVIFIIGCVMSLTLGGKSFNVWQAAGFVFSVLGGVIAYYCRSSHTIRNVFHTPRFVVGFTIIVIIVLTTVLYPMFDTRKPLEIYGDKFMKPGTYFSVYDANIASYVPWTSHRVQKPGTEAEETRKENFLPKSQLEVVAKFLARKYCWEQGYLVMDVNRRIEEYEGKIQENENQIMDRRLEVEANPDMPEGKKGIYEKNNAQTEELNEKLRATITDIRNRYEAGKIITDDRAIELWSDALGIEVDQSNRDKLIEQWEENYRALLAANDKESLAALGIEGDFTTGIGFMTADTVEKSGLGFLSTDKNDFNTLDTLINLDPTGKMKFTQSGAKYSIEDQGISLETYTTVDEVANKITFPLGTDNFGRDVLNELIDAAGTSLLIGLLAGTIATILGLIFGLLAGYVGGKVDDILSFIMNIFTVIPGFVLMIIIYNMVDQSQRGVVMCGTIIGITSWVWTARSVRSQVISLRNRDHVNLSKLSGHSLVRIILTDILPYIASYVVMAFILQVSSGILAEAQLSILNLGPNMAEGSTLGLMMLWAKLFGAYTSSNAWWAYFPVIGTIALISFSLNLMNTGLDQVFNPTLRD